MQGYTDKKTINARRPLTELMKVMLKRLAEGPIPEGEMTQSGRNTADALIGRGMITWDLATRKYSLISATQAKDDLRVDVRMLQMAKQLGTSVDAALKVSPDPVKRAAHRKREERRGRLAKTPKAPRSKVVLDSDGSSIRLPSGRKMDSMVGICESFEGDMAIGEGYDSFSGWNGARYNIPDQADREALADYMIGLWTRFKAVK